MERLWDKVAAFTDHYISSLRVSPGIGWTCKDYKISATRLEIRIYPQIKQDQVETYMMRLVEVEVNRVFQRGWNSNMQNHARQITRLSWRKWHSQSIEHIYLEVHPVFFRWALASKLYIELRFPSHGTRTYLDIIAFNLLNQVKKHIKHVKRWGYLNAVRCWTWFRTWHLASERSPTNHVYK